MKKIDVYEFRELSEEAQAVAMRNYEPDICFMDFEHDIKCDLECLGFSGVELYYSFSYSQGDGFSFTGEIDWVCAKQFLGIDEKLDISIKTEKVTHRYPHYNTVRHSIESVEPWYMDENFVDTDHVLRAYKNWYKDKCVEYERRGYRIIEYYWDTDNIKAELMGYEDKFYFENGIAL